MHDEKRTDILGNPVLYRDEYLNKVRLELLGPLSFDDESLQNSSIASKPTEIFSCGILYPLGFEEFQDINDFEADVDVRDADLEIPDDDSPIQNTPKLTDDVGREEVELDFDDDIDLRNQKLNIQIKTGDGQVGSGIQASDPMVMYMYFHSVINV